MTETFILDYYNKKSNLVKFIKDVFARSIHENPFILNRDGLIYNSDLVLFDNITWRQNPQRFCEDYYGIYELYPIILNVNNISSVFKFNEVNCFNSKIISPKIDTIRSLIS